MEISTDSETTAVVMAGQGNCSKRLLYVSVTPECLKGLPVFVQYAIYSILTMLTFLKNSVPIPNQQAQLIVTNKQAIINILFSFTIKP